MSNINIRILELMILSLMFIVSAPILRAMEVQNDLVTVRSREEWQSFKLRRASSCPEQLSLGQFPEACFKEAASHSSLHELAVEQCLRSAPKIKSLDILVRHLKIAGISGLCRDRLVSQVNRLLYKLRETDPAQVYRFMNASSKSFSGTEIEYAQQHDTSMSQSNLVSNRAPARRRPE